MIPGIIDLIFLRFVIPFVLFIVTVVRYNGFSFIYLLFLLACPLLALKFTHHNILHIKTFSATKDKQLDRTHFNFTRFWNENQKRLWRAWAMDSLRMLITVLLVCFAGITSPSLPSCVYLLSFLATCTYWACRNRISSTPFASLRIFLLVYSGLHVCLYYLYQFPFFQAFCKDGSFLAR
ncbi:unnamed protein product [Schistosoma mattheei]|uniref:Piezo TM1-24 domain-containing protein n=1 Tax=Schistosoma mattheei TaxID=31246 RepID=A0A183NFW0_9TREM|nr:unnamed protein product [Schistosoma mattheei]